MPNKDVHRPVGMVAGASFAAWGARPEPWPRIIPEIAGGVAGGWLGAALPDWIDPPTCPDHRHFGHGAATTVGVVWMTADAKLRLQQQLRYRADELAQARPYLQNDFARVVSSLEELFLRFLAGFLNGVAAGYVSHLALDALTPACIPVFMRGY